MDVPMDAAKNITPDYLFEIEKRLKTGAEVVIEHKDF